MSFIPQGPKPDLRAQREVIVPLRLKELLELRLAHLVAPGSEVAQTLMAHTRTSRGKGKSPDSLSLRGAISIDHADQIARGLNSGFQMIEMAAGADEYVRPILIYYGCNQLLHAFSDALLDWSDLRAHHGMVARVPASGIPDETGIEIVEGFFFKVANTFAILEGRFTVYSARDDNDIPIVAPGLVLQLPPPGRTRPIASLSARPFPKIDVPVGAQKIAQHPGYLLAELLTQDASTIGHCPVSEDAWQGIDRRYDGNVQGALTDVLVAFASSHFCRYKPLVWRRILDGRETKIRIELQRALARAARWMPSMIASWLLHGHGTYALSEES